MNGLGERLTAALADRYRIERELGQDSAARECNRAAIAFFFGRNTGITPNYLDFTNDIR